MVVDAVFCCFMTIDIAESFASVFFFITARSIDCVRQKSRGDKLGPAMRSFQNDVSTAVSYHTAAATLPLPIVPDRPTEFGPIVVARRTTQCIGHLMRTHIAPKTAAPNCCLHQSFFSERPGRRSTADHSGPSFCSILLCSGFLCLCAFRRQR